MTGAPLGHDVPVTLEDVGADPEEADPFRPSRRAVTLYLSGALLAGLLLVAMLVPLPYAVERPGPTVDTLSEHDGRPIVQIDGAETYPTSGQLRLTTVSVSGGPGFPVTAVDVLGGWLDPDVVVVPRESVFRDDASREEVAERSTAQMTSSQTSATVAALEELGYDVPMRLTVAGAAEGTSAADVLRVGDVITSVTPEGGDRTTLTGFADLQEVLSATAPGTEIAVGIDRAGTAMTVPVTTFAHPPVGGDEPRGSLLGVYLEPDVELPFDVDFDITRIGGPSAGTMFALAVVDRLTPGEMTGGQVVAGTGTMDLGGDVGAISGIRQKLVGAARDGARWFLAPRENCDEVVGHVPGGLRVVEVETLSDARSAVEAIGEGRGEDLPTCHADAG